MEDDDTEYVLKLLNKAYEAVAEGERNAALRYLDAAELALRGQKDGESQV
ncbi:MAG: hypothetical protein WC322_06545 [Candidatus Paceibacterota bacterium]|jgi:Ser/Thr protein kinase RdoA (MazF antagonist)